MQDFKVTTKFYVNTGRPLELREDPKLPINTVVRAEYGFTCIQGNSGPYFAVTAEEWACDMGYKPRGKEPIACGQLHEAIMSTPELAAKLGYALRFHLFDPNSGPMHYEANALYWFREWDGMHLAARKNFASTVCYHALGSDTHATLAMVGGMSEAAVKVWLADRLPRLKNAFYRMVRELGLSAELDAAQAQYTPAPQIDESV